MVLCTSYLSSFSPLIQASSPETALAKIRFGVSFYTTKIPGAKIDHSNYCRPDERVIKRPVPLDLRIFILSLSLYLLFFFLFKSDPFKSAGFSEFATLPILLEDSRTRQCCIFMMPRSCIYYVTESVFDAHRSRQTYKQSPVLCDDKINFYYPSMNDKIFRSSGNYRNILYRCRNGSHIRPILVISFLLIRRVNYEYRNRSVT